MKHKTIISAITLCTCILLTACGKEPAPAGVSGTGNNVSVTESKPTASKFADYIETDISKLEKNNGLKNILESGLGTFSGYTQRYHCIEGFVDDASANGKTLDDYVNERESSGINIVDFVKYADVSKEAYVAGINKCFPADSEDAGVLKDRERLLADVEVIYCGDEVKINNYFNENDGSMRTDDEANKTAPTKNFYVIHGALMRHVGVKNYHPYLEHVFGTKYDNVKNFIEYFKIDKSTFEDIMKTAEASDFYDIDDLF